MNATPQTSVSPYRTDPWHYLREHTAARIALGRAGGSLPTRAALDFRLAHAQARDAVHAPFPADDLAAALAEECQLPAHSIGSACQDRWEYLQRPDLGRVLSDDSRCFMENMEETRSTPCDLVILVADGLSSFAATAHSRPLLAVLIPKLKAQGWQMAPIFVVRNGRVALQDEVGALMGARMALMLLGERPGLSASDSLGAYFTYHPTPGKTDAERNCVSNIRTGGLAIIDAAHTLHRLLTESSRRAISGVMLKDESHPALSENPSSLSKPMP